MILSKISIGVFLLRVAVQKIHKWIIYAAMAITGFTGAVFFFVTVFQCTPISYFCKFFKILVLSDMLTALSLRESKPTRLLRPHRCYHRPHFPLQCLCNHFRLYIRHITDLFNMGIEHARQDENNAHSCVGHGMHVSSVTSPQR
jgi:hypothetical protein